MKTYKANIINMNTGELLEIHEQPRPCLGKEFIDNITASMFFYSCAGGIDAESIGATISCGRHVICYMLLESHMDGSSIYADLSITRGHGDPLHDLRRMTIGE